MNLLHTVYEPDGNGPHPTIVALHGWGANAMDLLGLAPYLADGQFLVLCPQGRVVVPLGPTDGYGWFPLTAGGSPDVAAVTAGIEDARQFVEAAAQRYPVDRQKLVILGFSQGGVIAYSLALSHPEQYAGFVALSSWLPSALAAGLPSGRHERLGALVHHGSRDELIPVERGRESVEILRRLNVPVTYREFDMGHEINAASLTDLSNWLQAKILSPIVLV
jgi:phospholipase/carboxylesterase